MLKLAYEERLPLIFFGEGGGGRPGDVDADGVMVAGLDLSTFASFAKLSGRVPVVGLVSGYCFAGNAALLGCCDVIIAAKNSNIGMGGPVMIEGGGLGVFKPEEVGPMEVQTKNGVVDIAVADDKEMVAVAKQYLGYFQGTTSEWEAADQRLLRDLIPENRRRVYDVRKVIKTLADKGSFLELRPQFGPGMVTGLIRIEGRPFGLIANNCMHTAGAIEAEDADKAAQADAVVQRPWSADSVSVRYPGVHGRAGDRKTRPGSPCLPDVCGRCPYNRTLFYGCIAKSLRSRGHGHEQGRLP